MLVFLA